MAARPTRRRRGCRVTAEPNIPNEQSCPVDVIQWTAAKYRSELQKIGFKTPASLPKRVLKQLYEENIEQRPPTANESSTSSTTPLHEDTPVPNPSAELSTSSPPTSDSSVAVAIQALQQTANNLQSSMLSLFNQRSTPVVPTPPENTIESVYRSAEQHVPDTRQSPNLQAGRQILRVQSESLPFRDIVSSQIRKQILDGKDVNLASLLAQQVETDPSRARPSEKSEKSIVDHRLHRDISLTEFITAFGKFKRVMCERFPDRREELDLYEAHIVEISNTYGQCFYNYHKLFSAKAANALYASGQLVDWSSKDRDILLMVMGGTRAKSCDHCKSPLHQTQDCILMMNGDRRNPPQSFYTFGGKTTGPGAVPSQTPSTVIDRRGRQREFFQGSQICNDFNDRHCFRANCQFKHICKSCHSSDHASNVCSSTVNRTGVAVRKDISNSKKYPLSM